MRTLRAIACAGSLGVGMWIAGQRLVCVNAQQDSSARMAAAGDAEDTRAEIRSLEALLPRIPDRGATLFLLARKYAHIGDLQKALALLKECAALDAGFVPDPKNSPSLRPLESDPDFRKLLAEARHRYAPVHKAHPAITVTEKDLFPEGLAVDAENGRFYMGSMHRKKIVTFTLAGGASDFVKEGLYDLSPVGGVHVDSADHGVWASTDAGVKHRPELVHFDAQGKLIERYISPAKMPADLNDCVLRGVQEIFTTDTEGNHVYRFDRTTHQFTDMKLWRPVFEPNGLTLSPDGNVLFVADALGVIRVDLQTNESVDIDPGEHTTLSGVDGLYWYKGGFVAVQYGAGEYRVMRWKLSRDTRSVVASETLEYRTALVSDPTTGAILHDNFYFMANTGIYNLQNDKVVDEGKLEPVQIAVVSLQ